MFSLASEPDSNVQEPTEEAPDPQHCAVLWSRSWPFLLELERVKKLQLRAVAVWLRGTVVAK